ncbi:glycosyltransferase family protein [Lunatibacter salilacus]|uniref:glycosyltransferase n=1 Tax=Lunatibacter salilacus TaxID=2483804 RepID=UPI00131CDD72|nr:glycosyltransferase [Lunatibacter salilacus]
MRDKKRIIIASVLKPTEDSRMLYKFGFSLRETNKYEVYILGFSEKKYRKINNIHLYSLHSKPRTHPSRVLAPLRLVRYIFKIKPDVVILTTYELAPAVIFANRFLKFKLIYDIQENFSLNVLSNATLPTGLQRLAAGWIRWWERRIDPYVDHYLLAEDCYREEFPQLSNVTAVENKYSGPILHGDPVSFYPEGTIRFILAGTLTEVYGIMEGMKWFMGFNIHFPNQALHVIGHCPMKTYRQKLEELANGIPQINLELSNTPIPFERMQDAISKADCWLMPYQLIPSIATKMPTKLYESIARRKVVLITKNPVWEKLVLTHSAGLCIDFHKGAWTKSEMESLYRHTYFTAVQNGDIYWSEEAEKLLSVVESLIGS